MESSKGFFVAHLSPPGFFLEVCTWQAEGTARNRTCAACWWTRFRVCSFDQFIGEVMLFNQHVEIYENLPVLEGRMFHFPEVIWGERESSNRSIMTMSNCIFVVNIEKQDWTKLLLLIPTTLVPIQNVCRGPRLCDHLPQGWVDTAAEVWKKNPFFTLSVMALNNRWWFRNPKSPTGDVWISLEKKEHGINCQPLLVQGFLPSTEFWKILIIIPTWGWVGSTTNQTIEVEAYSSVAGEKPQEMPVNPLVLAEALLIWAVPLMVLKVG